MVDWSIILCANNHKTGNGTGTGRRTVTPYASSPDSGPWPLMSFLVWAIDHLKRRQQVASAGNLKKRLQYILIQSLTLFAVRNVNKEKATAKSSSSLPYGKHNIALMAAGPKSPAFLGNLGLSFWYETHLYKITNTKYEYTCWMQIVRKK